MKNKNVSGFLSLLVVGILFGISGPLGKLLAPHFSAYQVVFLRYLTAFVFAVIASLVLRKQFDLRGVSRRLLATFAVSFPISVIFFYLSVFNTKVSLAVFSLYIGDLVTSFILGKVMFKEKIDFPKILGLIFVFIGLILLVNPFNGFVLNIGFVYGLIAGVIQSLSSAYKKKIDSNVPQLSLSLLQTFVGIIVALIAMVASGYSMPTAISSLDVGVILLFGVMFLGITYLSIIGYQNFNLNLGSLVVSSELLFGPLTAWLIFAEKLTLMEFVGALFIAFALVISNMKLESLKKHNNH